MAARASEQHEAWAERMPRDVADLWGYIVALDDEKRTLLLAHCAARTVNALRLPWDRKPRSLQTADRLATALALDMAKNWTPTVDSYLGRVTKAHIVEAVSEGVSEDAARRIADMKKPDMAQTAEQLLAGTGWLPATLRTPSRRQSSLRPSRPRKPKPWSSRPKRKPPKRKRRTMKRPMLSPPNSGIGPGPRERSRLFL